MLSLILFLLRHECQNIAVLSLLQGDEIDGNDITCSILSIGRAVEGSMSGTSGALYSWVYKSAESL